MSTHITWTISREDVGCGKGRVVDLQWGFRALFMERSKTAWITARVTIVHDIIYMAAERNGNDDREKRMLVNG